MPMYVLLQCCILFLIHGVRSQGSQGVHHDCPVNEDGTSAYIKDGTPVDCTCELDDPSNGAGNVKWFHPNGFVLAEGLQRATLTLDYNTQGVAVCQTNWTVYPALGTCVKFMDSKKSWTDARTDCKNTHKADLVKITDADFNQFLYEMVLDQEEYVWIGLQDSDSNNHYKWLDEDELATFLNWQTKNIAAAGALDQPNNSSHDCVAADIERLFTWDDLNCSSEYEYICQKAATYKDNQDETYRCEGLSKLGQTFTTEYKTNFAYGPGSVTANIIGSVEINLDNENDFVYVKCDVDQSTTHPRGNATIQGVLTHPIRPFDYDDDDTNEKWEYYFMFRPSTPGVYQAKCVANNTVDGLPTTEDVFEVNATGSPQVTLSGCPLEPDGMSASYITEGLGIICNCTLTLLGNPVGMAYWLLGDVTVSSGNEAATLILDSRGNNQNYTCVGINTIGEGDRIYYIPRVAYGPTVLQQLYIDDEDMTFRLCYGQPATFLLQCSVSAEFVFPAPILVLRGTPGGDLEANNSVIHQNTFYSFFFPSFNVSGEYSLMCVGSNYIFPNITNSSTIQRVRVVEPPSQPPHVTINTDTDVSGGDRYIVKEGVTLNMTCSVDGGFPPVYHVSLTFASRSVQYSGTQSSLSRTIERAMDEFDCICSAQHIAGCYSDILRFTMDVKYGPDSITAGPDHISVFHLTEATRSDDVTFFCEVPENHFSSGIYAIMEGIPGGTLNPDKPGESVNGKQRFEFTFRPTVAENITLKFKAFNSHFPELSASTTKRFDILEFPEVSLHSDCPFNGDEPAYVKEGVTKTCTCKLTTVGNPVGVAQWVDFSGKVISSNALSSPLQLLYDPDTENNVFTCRGKSYLGLGNSINYEARFAYGPYTVSASSISTPAVKLCPGMSRSVTITCQVPVTSVKPAPIIVLEGLPSKDIYSVADISDPTHYKKRFWFHMNQAGEISVACFASNSVFSEITARFTRSGIIAQEPPSLAPKITINNEKNVLDGSTQTVQSGDTLDITCSVDGGVPLVDSVAMTCGEQNKESNGTMTSLSIPLTKTLNLDSCVCTAQHTTGCYDRTTKFTLDVQYPAEQTSFSVNSQTGTVTVVSGSTVTFRCTSEGNPKPSVTVRGQLSQDVLTSNAVSSTPFVQVFESILTVGLRHTGDYECSARNAIGGSTQQTVRVLVQGPPELYDQSQSDLTSTVKSDAKVSMVFNIISQPAPVEWTLVKMVSDGVTESELKYSSSEFDVAYTDVNIQFGKVAVELVSPPYDEVTKYKLTIDNGIGQLVVPFTAVMGSSSAVEEKNEDSVNIGVVAGGAIGGAVFLGLAVFIFLKMYSGKAGLPTMNNGGGTTRQFF